MGDEDVIEGGAGGEGGDGGRRRKRRRRRRRSGGAEDFGIAVSATASEFGDDVFAVEGDTNGGETSQGKQFRRRTSVEVVGTVVNVPSSGKNPSRKRPSRARRGVPGSVAARRRKLERPDHAAMRAWLDKMPEVLLTNLYKGLGGQPNRQPDKERVLDLAVRAVTQPGRLGTAMRQLHERDRKVMAALLQAGSIAQSDEFVRELVLSYAGHEREWNRSLQTLAERGFVMAAGENADGFFYVVPEVLVDGFLADLGEDLRLPKFQAAPSAAGAAPGTDDVRVLDQVAFCPPLDFTITTLATYIDQHRPRLTQRHELHRHDQEAMDLFFKQVWQADSELFSFHIDFLMMHQLVELRGDTLTLNKDVMDEWLQLESEDQRDLLFRALNKRFPLAEWVLWAIHEADGAWVAERPLVSMYRRWKRGEDWRERFTRGQVAASRKDERESFSFAPLVRIGLLDMGQWGQEKFYRLSPRGRQLLEPPEDDGFRQFYLTPSFEIMAPAGLAPALLFRIGEIAELMGCDRANTYKITDTMVGRAMERGWRRDDLLQFLRDNSQIGVPDNVEQTLKGWIGHRGDVEFHDLVLMTVHRSQIRRLEGNRRMKPYLLHRFAPGMYAVDRHRVADIEAALKEAGFDPSKDHRRYPGDPTQAGARQALHRQVAEARDAAADPFVKAAAVATAEKLGPVPGTRIATKLPTDVPEDLGPPPDPTETVRGALDRAMSQEKDVEMVYLAKNNQKLTCKVHPERFAFKSDAPVLVGLDREEDERRTYVLDRIEKVRVLA